MTAADLDRYDRVRALRWQGDRLELLDQRIQPRQVAWLS